MNEANEPDQPFTRIDERLPEKNQRVIVVCRKSSRYGDLDENGIWRSHYSNEKLEDVIGWAP